MSIQILNDIYKYVEMYCSNNGAESVLGYHNGAFIHYDNISTNTTTGEDWELIDLANVASRVMEHINSHLKNDPKFYLYVCPDNAYVCIEDPKDIDSDSIDLFDENEIGLMVGID